MRINRIVFALFCIASLTSSAECGWREFWAALCCKNCCVQHGDLLQDMDDGAKCECLDSTCNVCGGDIHTCNDFAGCKKGPDQVIWEFTKERGAFSWVHGKCLKPISLEGVRFIRLILPIQRKYRFERECRSNLPACSRDTVPEFIKSFKGSLRIDHYCEVSGAVECWAVWYMGMRRASSRFL